MLNEKNERELAYLAKVTAIAPMDAERLECVYINGWTCVCGKGDFHVGDFGVFFEPDSKLPDVEPFSSSEFLRKKDFKIKPQKLRGVVSQGLFMPLSSFCSDTCVPAWTIEAETAFNKGNNVFLTERLGVTYAVSEDNGRKAPSVDKYKRMAQRHPEIFKQKWAQWFMRRKWGRKLMFFFFGKKKDKKSGWPSWVIKTDEERCQNMPWLFREDTRTEASGEYAHAEGVCTKASSSGTHVEGTYNIEDSEDTYAHIIGNGEDDDNRSNAYEEWIATEKIDGTSTTFTMKGFGKKREFYVCSRNVVFDKPDKKCFYETNVYTEMAEKYHMEDVLSKTLDELHKKDSDIEFITIQGETYGAGVQKRDYSMSDHDMRVFNVIYGYKDGHTVRLNPILGKEAAENAGLKYVPIVDEHFKIPTTCDELLNIATGYSAIDGGMREGLVFRSYDGARSFKAVSNEFLLKYHQ